MHRLSTAVALGGESGQPRHQRRQSSDQQQHLSPLDGARTAVVELPAEAAALVVAERQLDLHPARVKGHEPLGAVHPRRERAGQQPRLLVPLAPLLGRRGAAPPWTAATPYVLSDQHQGSPRAPALAQAHRPDRAGHGRGARVQRADRLPVLGALGAVVHDAAHPPQPVPPLRLDRLEPRPPEARVADDDGAAVRGEDAREALEEAPVHARAVLCGEGMDLLMERDRPPLHRQRRLEHHVFLSPADRRQIRPIHEHDGAALLGEQSGGQRPVDRTALGVQVSVAEQTIDAFDSVAGRARAGEVASEVAERQALPLHQGFDGEQQCLQTPSVDERAGLGEPALEYDRGVHAVVVGVKDCLAVALQA